MSADSQESWLARCTGTTPRDRRNQLRFVWAILAWAICFTGASQLIKRGVVTEGPVAWLLAALPVIASVVVLVVYSRFLSEADELQRMIQLQGLAVGFGGTYFALTGYRVLERLGAPRIDLDDVSMVMIFFYVLATFVGAWRYR